MIQRQGARLLVSGPLTMGVIGAGYAEAMQPLEGTTWVVDFGAVEKVDSSAVSLMLAWLRNARQHGATLAFENVPAALRSLADLYDVSEALPLGAMEQ